MEKQIRQACMSHPTRPTQLVRGVGPAEKRDTTQNMHLYTYLKHPT